MDIKNEKYTIVYSKLIATSERPEIKIDWRVYTKDPDKPLIRDLIIEDLSSVSYTHLTLQTNREV